MIRFGVVRQSRDLRNYLNILFSLFVCLFACVYLLFMRCLCVGYVLLSPVLFLCVCVFFFIFLLVCCLCVACVLLVCCLFVFVCCLCVGVLLV